MKQIDDERIRFFLMHQALIEQWSRIEDDARAVCQEFLWSLEGDIKALANRLDDNVRVYKDDKSTSPKLFLYRESWRLDPEKAAPPVGIGIEWLLNNVGFKDRLPFVGLWKNELLSFTEVLREELAMATKDIARDEKSSKPTAWFLERTFVAPPNERYWDHLVPYRNLILEVIESYWSRYASSVDTAIQSLRIEA